MFLVREESGTTRIYEVTDTVLTRLEESAPSKPRLESAWKFTPHLGEEGLREMSTLCGIGRAAIGKTLSRAMKLLETVNLDDETVVEAVAA